MRFNVWGTQEQAVARLARQPGAVVTRHKTLPIVAVIGDLIANLAHYCDAEDISLRYAIQRGMADYVAEKPGRQLGFDGLPYEPTGKRKSRASAAKDETGASRSADHVRPDESNLTKEPMKLYTITVAFDDTDDNPIVDLLYCDHRPSWAEIVKIHPHLEPYHPDEDRIDIAEYDGVPYLADDLPARLFEAAPELFNACKAAMLRDDIADCELGQQIAAALAKAQGGASFPAENEKL